MAMRQFERAFRDGASFGKTLDTKLRKMHRDNGMNPIACVIFEQGLRLAIEQHLESHARYNPIPAGYSPADAVDLAPIPQRGGGPPSVLGGGTEAHALALVERD